MKWNLDVIGKTKIWFAISGIIILAGLIAMFTMEFNWGLDFTGGTVMEFNIGKPFQTSEITNILISHGVKDSQVKAIGSEKNRFLLPQRVLMTKQELKLLMI